MEDQQSFDTALEESTELSDDALDELSDDVDSFDDIFGVDDSDLEEEDHSVDFDDDSDDDFEE